MDKMKQFLNSLYFGDRWCEKMSVINGKVIFQINLISRLKKGTTQWNYYSDEDIEHGWLVFDEVVEFDANSELDFNDEIVSVDVVDKENDIYLFVVRGCSCNHTDNGGIVNIDLQYNIKAKNFYIFNPLDDSYVTE